MIVTGASKSKQRKAKDGLVKLGFPPTVAKYFIINGIASGCGVLQTHFPTLPVMKSTHHPINNHYDQRHTHKNVMYRRSFGA